MEDELRKSHLSDPGYGYDVVVSTSLASINANFHRQFSVYEQQVDNFVFIESPDGRYDQISLEEFTRRTYMNPFEISDQADPNSSEVRSLAAAGFRVGVRIKIGIPSGQLQGLPQVITLDRNNYSCLKYRGFMSVFSIVQYTPGQNGNGPSWRNYVEGRDGRNQLSYFEAAAVPVMKDLNRELELKERLKGQLGLLNPSDFKLKQLVLSLVVPPSIYINPSVPALDDRVQDVIRDSFEDYCFRVNEQNLLSISVWAVATKPSDSLPQLQLTSFQPKVSVLKYPNGPVSEDTSERAISACTIDCLCVTDGSLLQEPPRFPWNWMTPDGISDAHGTIAINRNAIAKYLLAWLLPVARDHCSEIFPNGTGHPDPGLTGEVTKAGNPVVKVEYSDRKPRKGLAWCHYTCSVTLGPGNKITVEQEESVDVHIFGGLINLAGRFTRFTFAISVNRDGHLVVRKKEPAVSYNNGVFTRDMLKNLTPGQNSLVNHILDGLSRPQPLDLPDLSFSHLQKFVFPGSNIFAFKSACFSDYQDLVCAITYVDQDDDELPANGLPKSVPIPGYDTAAPSDNEPTLELICSTGVMTNYVQGKLVDSISKFEAVQAKDGNALLFALDYNKTLYVITEHSGQTQTGWHITDLSTAVIKEYFPGTDAIVDTFAVEQSALYGCIGLALSIVCNGRGNLFLSLHNDSSDISWILEPQWIHVPFDAGDQSFVTIAGINFAETFSDDPLQYIVVDVNRTTEYSVGKDIERYYVDPFTNPRWIKYDIPVDVKESGYRSCIGRKHKQRVDGIYTSGRSAGEPQLVYVPINNLFRPTSPQPTRLRLPNNEIPSSIATTRSGNATSDLYVVSGSTLYLFAADKQHGSKDAVSILTDPIFNGTETLLGMVHDGVTTLWGKNHKKEVYYLSCPTSKLTKSKQWTIPLRILSGIENVSAYMNVRDGSNTIFAVGEGRNLVKLRQATKTAAKTWRLQYILLPVAPTYHFYSFDSYTTTIQVVGVDKKPARNVAIEISADAPTPVYINGIYYVLRPDATLVPTDLAGVVTVVEIINNINGAILTVGALGATGKAVINPMHHYFGKFTSLNSVGSLLKATVSHPGGIIAGGVQGNSSNVRPLPPSPDAESVEAAAFGLAKLKEACPNVSRSSTPMAMEDDCLPVTTSAQSLPSGLLDAIEMAFEDIPR